MNLSSLNVHPETVQQYCGYFCSSQTQNSTWMASRTVTRLHTDYFFQDSGMTGAENSLYLPSRTTQRARSAMDDYVPVKKLKGKKHKALPMLYEAEKRLHQGLFIPQLLQPSLPDILALSQKNAELNSKFEERRKIRRKSTSYQATFSDIHVSSARSYTSLR
jgi:hypothetical protein